VPRNPRALIGAPSRSRVQVRAGASTVKSGATALDETQLSASAQNSRLLSAKEQACLRMAPAATRSRLATTPIFIEARRSRRAAASRSHPCGVACRRRAVRAVVLLGAGEQPVTRAGALDQLSARPSPQSFVGVSVWRGRRRAPRRGLPDHRTRASSRKRRPAGRTVVGALRRASSGASPPARQCPGSIKASSRWRTL
jgi:hypothetical protein